MARTKQIPRKSTGGRAPRLTTAMPVVKKRYRPGAKALREIRKYVPRDSVIPRLPFQRLVREVAHDLGIDVKFQSFALFAIQEAAEAVLTRIFRDSDLCAKHAGRMTVTVRDMRLARRLRGD